MGVIANSINLNQHVPRTLNYKPDTLNLNALSEYALSLSLPTHLQNKSQYSVFLLYYLEKSILFDHKIPINSTIHLPILFGVAC